MNPVVNALMNLAVAGSPVLSILLKVTLTTLLALTATRVARRGRASIRYSFLVAAFALLAVLPVASALVPAVRVKLPVQARQETVQSSFAQTAAAAKQHAEISDDGVLPASETPQPAMPSLATLLFVTWIAGAFLFLLPVAAGLWQTRSLRRLAIPWRDGKSMVDRLALEAGLRCSVDVLIHESVAGPMTCGALRPAILLPFDARTWNRDELARAIVHELEHVRRNDWMSRCVARVVCSAYWFHPLVWIAWRQLVLEAERACDDAVLQRGEATAYADQLVVLAQRLLLDSNQPILAMANRHDLAKRVSSLLDHRQSRGRAGVVWVGLAAAISALIVTTISPLYLVALIQTPAPPADSRKFEVATVRPCRDEDFRIGDQRRQETTISPGRITVNCVPLARIIYFAYAGIGNMDNPLINDNSGEPGHVRGGPGWIQNETFYLEARAEGTPERTVMMGPMLRALLEDRFKLKTHRELEEVPMYALTVAKGGLKIKPIDDNGCISFAAAQNLSRDEILAADSGSRPVCGNFTSLGNRWKRTWALGGVTLNKFANQTLSGVLDRHVMDKTEVGGRFNIHLEFGYDDNIKQGVFGGRPVGALEPPPPDIDPAPSIFTALEEQLGLKLEKTRGPRGFIVIDSVEPLKQN